MSHYSVSIVVLTALLASGCTANQLGAGPAQDGERYSQDRHVQYYEEIRAQAALGSRGNECVAR